MIIVATLVLGSWPKQRFARMWAKRGVESVGECENEHSHSQMNSHFGSWSPGGFPKLQRAIAKGKTLRLEEFFISLENYWSVDVKNGLAWPIWTFATQVMAKRKAKSQVGNLTPDHGKSGINRIPLRAGGVWHVVGKLTTRAATSV
jgi:hypothetical protein